MENKKVITNFILDSMYEILYGEDYPNFRFDFRQEEAIDFITHILKDYAQNNECSKATMTRLYKVINGIHKKNKENVDQPTMVVKNYKQFFMLLAETYDAHAEAYREQNEDKDEMDNFLTII